ncbi:MAG: esterase-like activity of phytase family protein [Chthoniobacterales bacterium]
MQPHASHIFSASLAAAALLAIQPVSANPSLIAIGTFGNTTDFSTQTNLLENGVDSNNVFGGIGSGLAWAGGTTFVATPDRGPNATTYTGGAAIDNTTSYTGRFETLNLALTNTASGSLPYTLTPTLTGTTLLYSPTALNYGAATPAANDASHYYFNGRSDNFGSTGGSTSANVNNARFDPEAIRVSNDGQSVFIADEYGPYVYKFDRASGQRTATYNLPAGYAIANQNSVGATEISSNTASGRVTNKGMEGLAITPDGTTLIGFMQSPLAQDGGDGGRANRIVTIDIATGTTHEYVYDNFLIDKSKTYNSSEILAINSHEFLVLERDGKGKGDGTTAVVKRLYKIDLTGAVDIGALNAGTGISGEANLLTYAVTKSLFLDLRVALNTGGITDANIPAKLEGATFGLDLSPGIHTLYVGNDNDFVPGVAGPSNIYAFSFSDADLGTTTANGTALSSPTVFQQQAVPEPGTWSAIFLGALTLFGITHRRRL